MKDGFYDMRKHFERGEYTPDMVVYYAVKKASQGADGPELRGFCSLMRDMIPLIKYPAKPNKFADIFVPKPWENVGDVYAYVTYWCEPFVETIDWLRGFVEEKSPVVAGEMLTKRQERHLRNVEIHQVKAENPSLSQQAIAERFGMSQQRVAQVLQEKPVYTEKTSKPARQQICVKINSGTLPETAAAKIISKFGRDFARELKRALAEAESNY